MTMDFSICLPNASVLQFDSVSFQEKTVVFHASSIQFQATCPQCSQVSQKIHSRYRRTLADLPLSGLAVRLICQVKKFFCPNNECARKIFVERLSETAEAFARRTLRLDRIICALAFYVGGRLGAKVTSRLSIDVSRQTLIRRILKTSSSPTLKPKVIGIDDFAFRRGHTYGTLLIDLERRKAVDLLPSRETEDVAEWLKQYPHAEVVSRDRSQTYANAVNAVLPHAKQIADRFHLVKNIYEVLEKILHRERKTIREIGDEINRTANRISLGKESLLDDLGNKLFREPLTNKEKKAHAKVSEARKRRIEKYETVKRLRREEMSINGISRRLRMHRETVRHFLRCDEYPEPKPVFRKVSPLYKYQEYMRQRWNEGCGNGRQLYRELLGLGYVGCYQTVSRFLQIWRQDLPEEDRLRIRLKTFRTPTAREIKWWLLGSKPSKDKNNLKFLEILKQEQPEVIRAVGQIREFQQILKTGSENDYADWKKKITEEGSPEMKNFVFRLEKDDQSVKGAITSEWSNGQVEGQVNRLKLIKRQMYGRANFEVLKARVLYEEAI